jgi:hypothetical protein
MGEMGDIGVGTDYLLDRLEELGALSLSEGDEVDLLGGCLLCCEEGEAGVLWLF